MVAMTIVEPAAKVIETEDTGTEAPVASTVLIDMIAFWFSCQ